MYIVGLPRQPQQTFEIGQGVRESKRGGGAFEGVGIVVKGLQPYIYKLLFLSSIVEKFCSKFCPSFPPSGTQWSILVPKISHLDLKLVFTTN